MHLVRLNQRPKQLLNPQQVVDPLLLLLPDLEVGDHQQRLLFQRARVLAQIQQLHPLRLLLEDHQIHQSL